MRPGCTVCALPVEALKAANELIQGGASSRDVERQFHVGRGPALRHKSQCLGITAANPKTKQNAQRRLARRLAHAVADAPKPRLDSIDDFRDELRRLYYKGLAQLEGAEASGDGRLAQKSLDGALATLQQLGRSIGAFQADNVVRIDAPQQRIVNVISGMSDEALRAFMAGDRSVLPPATYDNDEDVAS